MIIVNVGPLPATSFLHRLYLLPYGRASVLFVTVAGLGMGYLLTSRRDRLWPDLLWRVVLLFTLGLALQTMTDRVSIILQTYAVLFLFAPLLWRLPSRALAAVAAIVMVLGPGLIVYHDLVHPWHKGLQGVSVTTPPDDLVFSLTLSGPYPLASWTVPFIVGLLLARVDLRRAQTTWRMVVWGAVAAVGGAAVAYANYAVLGERADTGPLRLLTGVAHGQMPLWLISSVGGAVLVIGACLRWQTAAPRIRSVLADTGRFAFTAYVLHVVILALIMPADGFTPGGGIFVATALNAVIVGAAGLWSKTGRPGPLEWLLRKPWLMGPRSPASRP
ncbi:DUF418 domain-containing protein [Ornithinimicrobium sufpigmenti]|uniref:DUF418 domain-containing protein n=1 Tax=Ornithinimicrobium sufpigmenti TaxID=2508882 RepID=UPI0015E1A230|nr:MULTISPECIES: DUF418 domain-containing protein [unclassified Ornithinimicrobium]